MKKLSKIFALVLGVILCLSLMATGVFAEEVEKDGLKLTLTTDKDSYELMEEIKATLTVENVSGVPMNNIVMTHTEPQGLNVVGGALTKSLDALAAGASESLEVTYQTPFNPDTGDNSLLVVIFAVAIVSALAMVCLVWNRKTAAMVLALVMVMALAAPAVNAAEVGAEVSTTVTVDGQKMVLTASVAAVAEEPQPEEPTDSNELTYTGEVEFKTWRGDLIGVVTEIKVNLETMTVTYTIDGEEKECTGTLNNTYPDRPKECSDYIGIRFNDNSGWIGLTEDRGTLYLCDLMDSVLGTMTKTAGGTTEEEPALSANEYLYEGEVEFKTWRGDLIGVVTEIKVNLETMTVTYTIDGEEKECTGTLNNTYPDRPKECSDYISIRFNDNSGWIGLTEDRGTLYLCDLMDSVLGTMTKTAGGTTEEKPEAPKEATYTGSAEVSDEYGDTVGPITKIQVNFETLTGIFTTWYDAEIKLTDLSNDASKPSNVAKYYSFRIGAESTLCWIGISEDGNTLYLWGSQDGPDAVGVYTKA